MVLRHSKYNSSVHGFCFSTLFVVGVLPIWQLQNGQPIRKWDDQSEKKLKYIFYTCGGISKSASFQWLLLNGISYSMLEFDLNCNMKLTLTTILVTATF